MPIAIERTLKSTRNIMRPAVARRSHRLGSSQAPASRTANEEKGCVGTRAQLAQTRRKLIDEGCVGLGAGKCLPLNRNNLFPDRTQVRETDKSPLRLRSDIYEYSARLLRKPSPDLLDLYILDLGLMF